jgi:hypothetical protein
VIPATGLRCSAGFLVDLLREGKKGRRPGGSRLSSGAVGAPAHVGGQPAGARRAGAPYPLEARDTVARPSSLQARPPLALGRGGFPSLRRVGSGRPCLCDHRDGTAKGGKHIDLRPRPRQALGCRGVRLFGWRDRPGLGSTPRQAGAEMTGLVNTLISGRCWAIRNLRGGLTFVVQCSKLHCNDNVVQMGKRTCGICPRTDVACYRECRE